VRGPQGDLRAANRIEVYLAAGESKVERLEAYTGVTGAVENVTMTGDRLTYRAAEDRYDVTGTNRTLARADVDCQRFTGNTLTFSRAADTMKVDGRQVFRTGTARRSGC
jgi:lipopolysaccharide export system protein LptA